MFEDQGGAEIRLGICPMSTNIIDATIRYAKEKNTEIMLIASRRQVEDKKIGNCYVLNTTAFVKHIESRNPTNILICRDHGGPYMGYDEEKLLYKEAMEKAKKSFVSDIMAGFDLLHIDCSLCKGTELVSALNLLKHCQKINKEIKFEIGTEENAGSSTSAEKFEKELSFFTKHGKPEFVVGQTGSLVKETFQAGIFDKSKTKELTEIAHDYGAQFKEHNADYLSNNEIELRGKAGVDAVNIGPQMATTQTRIVMYYAKEYGFNKELDAFIEKAVSTKKWKKWMYGPSRNKIRLAVIAGHYAYGSIEYEKLYNKIAEQISINKEIEKGVFSIIENYLGE